MKTGKKKLLVCRCAKGGDGLADTRQHILEALTSTHLPVEAIDDLCELAARKDPQLLKTAAEHGLQVVACYPRAVKAMLEAAGCKFEGQELTVYNPRTDSEETIVAKLLAEPAATDSAQPLAPGNKSDGWVPWFPLIDYERCTNCKQCLNFCLFGVYGLNADGKVEVVNPQGCKTNCPACARICPHIAIIFPKYAEAPINGAPITDENQERAKVKVNMNEILGPDVYGALAARRQKARPLLFKKPGAIDLSLKPPTSPKPPA